MQDLTRSLEPRTTTADARVEGGAVRLGGKIIEGEDLGAWCLQDGAVHDTCFAAAIHRSRGNTFQGSVRSVRANTCNDSTSMCRLCSRSAYWSLPFMFAGEFS
jgi:hypothetical protein